MIPLIRKLLLKHFKVLSFDVFDTLIERDVSRPTDLFIVIGDSILGNGEGVLFCKNRIEAEHAARKMNAEGEVSLDEIYDQLKAYSEDIRDALKAEEIKAEVEHCYPKKSVKPIFDEAILRGKKIFIVSDMYLPSAVIAKMLSKCGYAGYTKLYVSNEHGSNKISGLLFKKMLEENSLNRKDVVHLGDSLKADFLGALKNGIRPYFISRKNRIGRILKF